MDRVMDLLKSYSKDAKFKINETIESYTLETHIQNINKDIIWEDIKEILKSSFERDEASINISVNDGDPYTLKLDNEEQINLSTIEAINGIIETDSDIKIRYLINKNKQNNTISVYDINEFSTYLNGLKLDDLLKVLHSNLNLSTFNKFEVFNNEQKLYYQSPLFIFATTEIINKQIDHPIEYNRENILQKRTRFTNAQKLSEYKFVPEDFSKINDSCDSKVGNLFEKLKIVISASFISNISNIIQEKQIQLGIIGYKYIDTLVDFNELNIKDAVIFFDIYQWIYSEGETSDKLDLSRNIISRYFIYSENKWVLPKESFNSIQSAHVIYLKENVEKYIETKNKVSEITAELSIKSNEITQHFISSFKYNNITIMTYYISIFVFNSLSSNDAKKIFTIEIFYLSMVLLLLSTTYLLFIRFQVCRDIKLNIRYFYSMKRIYKDIFDIRELSNLFHKRHLKYNIKNIEKTINNFSIAWLIETFLLLIITIYLTFFI